MIKTTETVPVARTAPDGRSVEISSMADVQHALAVITERAELLADVTPLPMLRIQTIAMLAKLVSEIDTALGDRFASVLFLPKDRTDQMVQKSAPSGRSATSTVQIHPSCEDVHVHFMADAHGPTGLTSFMVEQRLGGAMVTRASLDAVVTELWSDMLQHYGRVLS